MSMLETRSFAEIDEWQTEMLLKPLRIGNIQLYTTNLSKAELAQTYVKPVASLEQAIRSSVEKQGSKEIAVIPEGPYVVPRYVGD
jgi:hypothetical protein